MSYRILGKKSHKYGATKVSRAGYSFASKLESSVFGILELRKKAGEITEIQVQDSVKLTDAGIDYRPDFKCTLPDGSFLWVEAKGMETPAWNIKKKLWRIYGPGPLEIWQGSHMSPKLVETIIPKEVKK